MCRRILKERAVHWSPRKPEMRLNSCDTCESYGPACLNISPLASIRLLLCFYSYILVENWLNLILKENSAVKTMDILFCDNYKHFIMSTEFDENLSQ